MKQANQIYGFRLLSAVVLLTVAIIPVLIKPNFMFALVLYPIVLITLMTVMAFVEQYLLLREQKVKEVISRVPVKVHKLQMKKMKSQRHAGCRLLGLSCAA